MKPDEPFNYWQNTPATAVPPANPAPVAPTPVQQPVVAPQPQPVPVVAAPIAQSFDPTHDLQPTPAPAAQIPVAPIAEPMQMYAPQPDEVEPTPQVTQPETPEEMPSDDQQPDSLADNTIHWSASEYIFQEKNGLWFMAFAILVLGLISLDIFALKTYTFSALIAVMAVAVVVYYRRPPAEISYTLSPQHGLYVGEKLRTFEEFKSFAVISDNGSNYIMLVPTKRFSPALSVYFPTESGEQIVDVLGQILPMEQRKLDAFDYIVRKLRI